MISLPIYAIFNGEHNQEQTADLNWGMNDIFNKDFKTITFDMYAVYLNVGFGYAF